MPIPASETFLTIPLPISIFPSCMPEYIRLNCVGTRSVRRRFERDAFPVVRSGCSAVDCLISCPPMVVFALIDPYSQDNAKRCSMIFGQGDVFPYHSLDTFALILGQLGKSDRKDAAFDPGHGGIRQAQGRLTVF